MKQGFFFKFNVVTIVMSLIYGCSVAQPKTDYGDAIAELIYAVDDSASALSLKQSAKSYLSIMVDDKVSPSDTARVSELLDSFIEENFEEQLLKPMLVKYYKDKLALDEIHGLTSLLKSEAGVSFNSHYKILERKLPVEKQKYMPEIDDILANRAQSVKYQCPDSYAKKFMPFYEGSAISKKLEVAMNLMSLAIDDDDKESKKQCEDIARYMFENYPVVVTNVSYGIMSDADLDFAIALYANPVYMKIKETSDDSESSDVLFPLFNDLQGSYVKWLSAHGIELKKADPSSPSRLLQDMPDE